MSPFRCLQALSEHGEPPAHHRNSEPFRLHRSRSTYVRDVQACKDALYEGDSYELCLTTALSRDGPVPDPLHLYSTLRQHSPAPYAAFLSFGEGGPHVSGYIIPRKHLQLCHHLISEAAPQSPKSCVCLLEEVEVVLASSISYNCAASPGILQRGLLPRQEPHTLKLQRCTAMRGGLMLRRYCLLADLLLVAGALPAREQGRPAGGQAHQGHCAKAL